MTATDLDQGGNWQQSQNVYLGPTLGFVRVVNIPTTVTTATYSVPAFVFQPPNINIGPILVNRNGTVTISLPSSINRLGYPLEISDVGGFAASQNITITPFGAETIMGLASLTIANNYGSFILQPIISGGWYV